MLALVVLGDRHHQAQVRVDHALLGLEVAALDAARQLVLLLGGQQAVPADLVQEQLQGVGFDRGGCAASSLLLPLRHRAKRPTRRLYDAPVTALSPPVLPQLALSRAQLPEGEGWSYEPKWDGFRAIAFVDGDEHFLQSRNGRPLGRYFPELRFPPGEYVLDGELVILGEGGKQEFDALQQRIHPAESRVRRLAEEMPGAVRRLRPARSRTARSLLDEPFARRRKRLEKLVAQAARPDALRRATAPRPSRGCRAPRA